MTIEERDRLEQIAAQILGGMLARRDAAERTTRNQVVAVRTAVSLGKLLMLEVDGSLGECEHGCVVPCPNCGAGT